ncbi:MAG TPA: hypothetical protein VNZ55_12790, partial [Thermomicrobiales bacterium]|nr:hypothetical protein [Thermomicrobiales bacterium]
ARRRHRIEVAGEGQEIDDAPGIGKRRPAGIALAQVRSDALLLRAIQRDENEALTILLCEHAFG